MATPPAPSPTTPPTRVLVVDDDPTVAEVVSRYLTRGGLTVDSVGDGAEALARAAAALPDVVVLDLTLPGVDGLARYHRTLREKRLPLGPPS